MPLLHAASTWRAPRPVSRRAVLRGSAGAAITALAGLAGSGCSAPTPTIGPSPDDADFDTAGSGTIQFWARADVGQISQEMVRRFHAAQNDIRVELTLVPGTQLVTKLATSIRGGSQPDVFGFDDFFGVALAYYGALTDLTEPINRLPYAKSLSPAMQQTLTLGGRLYGVPYDSDLSAYWFNNRLFEKAGLDPGSPPTSLAALIDAADAVQRSGAATGIAIPGTCGPCLAFAILPNIWAGGQHMIEGEPGRQRAHFSGNDALRQVLEHYHRGWASGLTTPASRTQSGPTWGADFRQGRVGLFPGGYGSVVGQVPDDQLGDFTIAPLPGPSGGRATFTGGDDIAIPAGARNPSAAWRFIRFVLAEEQQLALPGLGFTPVRTDLLTPDYKEKYPHNAVLLEMQQDGYIELTVAANVIFSQANGAFPSTFARAVFEGDIDGAISSGQSQAQAALDEVNER